MRTEVPHSSQAGFSLLEVLITLVVLGAGLISLAKFQGTVLQDNDQAKVSSVAIRLAEQKIEQLRGFRVLTDAERAAGDLSYQSIDSSTADEELTVSNITYTRSWTVASFCFTARNSAAVAAGGAACRRPVPDFKNIRVIVEWTDQDGNRRDVRLATSIAALDPAYSGRVRQIDARRDANSCNELVPPEPSGCLPSRE